MNIYCIGRNYAQHAKELGNDVPSEPMVFMKPTHALVRPEGTIAFPSDQGEIHYEVELVVKLGKDYSPSLSLSELIDAYAVGIDFTLRDKQTELKKKGHPWLVAKGFHNSAVLGSWNAFDEASWKDTNFSMEVNGNVVQEGSPKEMIFDLETLFAFIDKHLGLKAGDIIYTGTPAGVGPISDNDSVVLKVKGESQGTFSISMK